MSFRIDSENIDYIFGKSHSGAYEDKLKTKVLKDLHFNNGKASSRIKKILSKLWW